MGRQGTEPPTPAALAEVAVGHTEPPWEQSELAAPKEAGFIVTEDEVTLSHTRGRDWIVWNNSMAWQMS